MSPRFGVESDDEEAFDAVFGGVPSAASPVARQPVPPTPARGTPPTAASQAVEPAPAGAEPDLAALQAKWRIVIEELRRDRRNTSVATILADTAPARIERGELVIRFPRRSMADHFQKQLKTFQEPLAAAILRVTGYRVTVRAEYGADPGEGAAPASARIGAPGSAPAPAAPRQTTPNATSDARVDAAPSRPPAPAASTSGDSGSKLIHNVLEVFEGRMMENDEGPGAADQSPESTGHSSSPTR